MLTGSIVAMVTPMNSDGSIDWDSLVGLVNYHIDKDTDGIVSVGTTGESATLSPEEHIQVIEKTIGAARGRIPVIAGTGSNSTEETISLTRSAAEVGASACLLVVPYYNKPRRRACIAIFGRLQRQYQSHKLYITCRVEPVLI